MRSAVVLEEVQLGFDANHHREDVRTYDAATAAKWDTVQQNVLSPRRLSMPESALIVGQ